MTLRLARWAALGIAFGAVLVLLLASTGCFASDVDPGDEDASVALLSGLDVGEELTVPMLVGMALRADAGLLMPRPEAWRPIGRRVVSEIFRPPIA